MRPSESERVALLKRLLAEPREVADEELEAARQSRVVSDGADLARLLRTNDLAFFGGLDAIPGVRRHDLSLGWWNRTVRPILAELEQAHQEGGEP